MDRTSIAARRSTWTAAAVAILTATATAQGSGGATLPPAPLEWLASDDGGPQGAAVQVVDARTGEELDAGGFRWVGDVPQLADGSWRLPRGKSWFEVRVDGYLARREGFSPPADGKGTLRVPLLPRVAVVRGRVQPPWPCALEVGDAGAGLPGVSECDADGSFCVLVGPDVERIELTVRAVGRSHRVELAADARGVVDLAPFQDVEAFTFAEPIGLPAEMAAAMARYRARFAERGRDSRVWSPAVEAALAWLAAHQDDNGRMDASGFMRHDTRGEPCDGKGDPLCDVGVTGLTLLAFLGDGNTPRHGPYRDRVRVGAEWLLRQQVELKGGPGVIATIKAGEVPHHFFYEHCIATQALCEAAGLGCIDEWRPAVQAAVDYIARHRNPYSVWRYQPRSNDNDMSITAWAVQALTAARDFGFTIEHKALPIVQAYVDDLTDADSGRTGYVARGGFSSRLSEEHGTRFPWERTEAMTAAALVVRLHLGQAIDEPGLERSVGLVAAMPPRWGDDESSRDFYYWYLGAQAMVHAGRRPWQAWSKALTSEVVRRQRRDGAFAGSWDATDAWGDVGGRVYSTALLTLALQAPHRYAP